MHGGLDPSLEGALLGETSWDMLGGQYTQSDSQVAARGDAAFSLPLLWLLVIIVAAALSNLNHSWCDSWESATLVNQSLVTDPTIRQPGFDLPHRTCYVR